MSKVLPGRTENSIKNYFYSSIRRIKSNKIIETIKSIYHFKNMKLEDLD